MNLVTVNVDTIRIGHPLPFSLRDESGVLLAAKGYVVDNRDELELMVGRRTNLFIDVTESESHHRAYVGKLHTLVREDRPLGQIAESQFSSLELASSRDTTGTGEPDWLDLQVQAHAMLRDSNPASFRDRLDRLQAQLSRHARLNPDGTLFALIHLSSSEVQLYSATHAMLVSVMCSLAAREVLKWPAEMEATLCSAALTMNIGMTELQDRLAVQKEPPSPEQRRQIDQHALRSVRLLEQLGVNDSCWLEAVLDHHTKTPGPLAGRGQSQRMARLIQRADMFAARLAPRASRPPELPATAMQASYFDENRQIDEAGAALIKAVGIYSPGSFVRLATNEIAVVIKRGANTTTPRVAILINRAGMPTGELIVRDTSQRDFRIVTSVAERDVKVKINLQRLLVLTKAPASDRLWQGQGR
ncbi:HD-GYP domain-containing protein [Rhodoferax sp.]|uniref:HD-GYP domain-containing protein n=1 Tax=Rhodoferax sp. TaxID=50421 RepID=UPI002724FF55|nr:phosphohydrolase [Rhodoferax sp.]MDO9197962.1 phosphohydrolase [Rhodoferax sp.]